MLKKIIIVLTMLLLCGTIKSYAKVYLLMRAIPLGGIDWVNQGGQTWSYERRDIQLGLGYVTALGEHVRVSTRQYGLLDKELGIIGATGNMAITLDEILAIRYEYTYRWYTGSKSDYGYATGHGTVHRVAIDFDIPLF